MSKRWYVGDPQECPWQSSVARIAWGEAATDGQREAIDSLILRPSPSQVLPALVPDWIAQLPHCRELWLPILHLAELRPERLPALLDTLGFEASPRWLGPDGSGAPSWPGELRLPDLRGLVITGNMTSLPEGLRPALVPALARLSAAMDKRGELIDRICEFGQLRELELVHVGNHDVFEPLDGEIEVLRLRGGGRHFPFDAITRWRSIARLELYDLQCTIDCEVLAELARLSEVRMSYCKKVVGIESLLECPALRSVTLVNCGRPFKDAALRQAFVDHGFEQLEIARA